MTKEERDIIIRAVKDNPDKKYEQIGAELALAA
jgi:hypothetical protein